MTAQDFCAKPDEAFVQRSLARNFWNEAFLSQRDESNAFKSFLAPRVLQQRKNLQEN